ncbi:MAG TPA: hypothetical protein VD968_11445 [Pyrinomonadaceae bacterium]|nr:hypothetical protein [Pyrinomonadaceae bacterium]
MKKQITRTFAIVAALIALAGSTVTYAQATRRVVVDIPFEFTAGAERMPAGRYTVSKMVRDSESALVLRSEDGSASVVVLTNAAEAGRGRAALTFRLYAGDQYFLSRVWIPGTAAVRSLPQSAREKRLRRELRAKSEGRPSDGADGAKTITVTGELN